MNKNENIWNECLVLIKKHTTEQAFETWFEGVSLIDLNEEVATLQVPNRFHYEWVESKYGDLISRCIKQAVGKKLNVNYSIVINNDKDNIDDSVKKIDELIPSTFHRASQMNRR